MFAIDCYPAVTDLIDRFRPLNTRDRQQLLTGLLAEAANAPFVDRQHRDLASQTQRLLKAYPELLSDQNIRFTGKLVGLSDSDVYAAQGGAPSILRCALATAQAYAERIAGDGARRADRSPDYRRLRCCDSVSDCAFSRSAAASA